MTPANAMFDSCFSPHRSFSWCTLHTKAKVAQQTRASNKAAGTLFTALVPARLNTTTSTSALAATRKPELDDWSAGGPRHALVAQGTAESPGALHRCFVSTPPPALVSHFQNFFGVSLPSEGQPCGAEACGAFCGPALLEARCSYGTEDDARLQEVLELLKRM